MRKSEILVIIPHYNNPSGLMTSLLSIKENEKVDVLVVDDGSLTKPLVESEFMGQVEDNVTLFFRYMPKNKGIEHALNLGLQLAKNKLYRFIARLDCGDLCTPNRFQTQRDFLERHQKIGMVGSNVSFLDIKGVHQYDLRLPPADSEIRKKMYLNAMFIHPTIMLKGEVLKTVGKYPTQYKAAEDYAFFFEIMKEFEVANINEILVLCELNPKGISITRRRSQIISRIKIILKHFYFGYYPIIGLMRNLFLLVLPYRVVLTLKRRL